ncbi:MAG: hypothetical protein LKE40_14120 [Spirochaetia bacterium]|jgi:hypothetical protein|nr:hypothetical protein [Spirochaetia bacterium]
MKKVIPMLLVAMFCTIIPVSASDVHFVFGSGSLWYLNAGGGYKGFTAIKGNTTDFQALLGLGYISRDLWQNSSGGGLADSSIENEYLRADLTLKAKQGFFNDDLTCYAGATSEFDYHLSGLQPDSSVYPDLNDTTQLAQTLFAGALYDRMDDKGFVQNGYSIELKGSAGPSLLNEASSFVSFHAEARGAKTLFYIPTTRGKENLFSIVLVDRAMLDYTKGDKVPLSFQKHISLGSNVRGYASYSYNTEFTAVNNFDIRFSTYEFDSLPFSLLAFPRVVIFFDVGYAGGNYLNSDVSCTDNILASTGIQMTVSVNDFIDLGYQMAYLLVDADYAGGSDTHLTGEFLLRLAF